MYDFRFLFFVIPYKNYINIKQLLLYEYLLEHLITSCRITIKKENVRLKPHHSCRWTILHIYLYLQAMS